MQMALIKYSFLPFKVPPVGDKKVETLSSHRALRRIKQFAPVPFLLQSPSKGGAVIQVTQTAAEHCLQKMGEEA